MTEQISDYLLTAMRNDDLIFDPERARTPQDCKSTVCADNVPTPVAAEPVAIVLPGNGYLAEVPDGLPPGTRLYAAPLQPAAAPEDAALAEYWRKRWQRDCEPLGEPTDEAIREAMRGTEWLPMRDEDDAFEFVRAMLKRFAPEDAAGMGAPWVPYLSDRADGVKGRYAIARHNPAGYREVWNLRSHKWAAFSDDVLTLEEANRLLQNVVIPTALAASSRAQQGAPVAIPDVLEKAFKALAFIKEAHRMDEQYTRPRKWEYSDKLAAEALTAIGAALAGLQAGRDGN